MSKDSRPLHRTGWRRDIQGLRAIAVLIVIAYHAELPIPGGFVGVDVFFVISGFVITLLLLRQSSKPIVVQLRGFWAGRIRRILPALSVVVVASLVMSALIEDPSGAQQQTVKTAITALLMVSNVFLERSGTNYFLDPTYVNPLLNTWSLGVEEQFYLLFPLIVVAALSWHRRRTSALTFILGLIVVLSLMWCVFTSFTSTTLPFIQDAGTFAFYSVTTRAWQFGAGALLALGSAAGVSINQYARNTLGVVGLALITTAMLLLDSNQVYPGLLALLPTLGAVALISAGLGGSWFATGPLQSSFAQFIGDRSYSLYLWHWPLLVFAGILFANNPWGIFGALLLTFICASATYRWVENPFRFATNKRMATLGGISLVVIGLLMAAAFAQAVKVGWWQSWTLGAHQAMQRDCDNPPIDPERCAWGPEGGRPFVLVVGDSQAWASGDAVIEAATSKGGSVVIASFNNCPFTAGLGSAEGSCEAWQADVMQYITDAQPDVVIVANATYGGGITPQLTDSIMSEIDEAGAKPVVLLNPPDAGDDVRRSLLIAPPGNRTRPLTERQFSTTDVSKLREQWGNDSIIDPFDALCDETQCAIAVNGSEFYTDNNHLSIDGARLLVPYVARSISSDGH